MPLFQRLTGTHPTRPKIPVHAFQSLLGESVRGFLTEAEANTLIGRVSRLPDGTEVPLDATELAQARALISDATAKSGANRAMRWIEFDQCMLLADTGLYTADQLRTRLTT